MSVPEKVYREVVYRDAYAIWQLAASREMSFQRFLLTAWLDGVGHCIVEVIWPELRQECSGRMTLDHVKDQPMMGKRAPSDEWHLVICCWYHNVHKPPSKEFRARERAYLADQRAAATQQGRGGDEPEVAQDRQPRGGAGC